MHDTAMKPIQVQRKSRIDPAEFARDHLQDAGLPVIITDAIDHWPARTKWTFEHLKKSYGSDKVIVSLGGLNSEYSKLTGLAAFMDHLDTPGEELPGFWLRSADKRPVVQAPAGSGQVHYLLDWLAFQAHPELESDILPAPYFVDDWVLALSPTLRDLFQATCGREYWSIYIGPKDTVSELHRDFWRTHACLTQIQGRKRAMLFSPADTEFLYDGLVNPEAPDSRAFPLFEQATPYCCDLAPGETLFIPPDWWHHVRGLDKSITVSHNFFNGVNVNEHLAGLLQHLPALAKGIARNEPWREQLGVKWPLPDNWNT